MKETRGGIEAEFARMLRPLGGGCREDETFAKTSAATRCRIGACDKQETTGEESIRRWARCMSRHGRLAAEDEPSYRGRKEKQRQAEAVRSRANGGAAIGPP